MYLQLINGAVKFLIAALHVDAEDFRKVVFPDIM
jgi:hypothetical protein